MSEDYKDIPYIDQSANEIEYVVALGEIDKKQFNILKTYIIENLPDLDGIRIDANIIGSSHLIQIRTDEMILNEVFSCMSVESDNILVNSHANVVSDKKLELDGWDYEFTCDYLDWSRGMLIMDELQASNGTCYPKCNLSKFGLEFIFPNEDDDSKIAATVIFGVAKDVEITWYTIHTYPNEDTVVYTKTKLSKKNS